MRVTRAIFAVTLPGMTSLPGHRLLADARYLHREFTGLKHVGAPTAMLEVIVQEKRVRAPSPAAIEAAAPQPQPPSASRFKGYLQRTNSKRTSLLSPTPVPPTPQEKPLPAPTPVVPSPDPLARRLSAALSPAARSEDVLAMTPSAPASQLDLAAAPSPAPAGTNANGNGDAVAEPGAGGLAPEGPPAQADGGALSPAAVPLPVTPSAPLSATAKEKPQPPVPVNVPNGHAAAEPEEEIKAPDA